MTAPLLLTSFAPWRAHQRSNSSDDLLAGLHAAKRLPANVTLLRQLPVNTQLAACQVMAKIVEVRPAAIICCGMAERRSLLNLEQRAHRGKQFLDTALDLPSILPHTRWTTISHDAGSFVCNALYYALLDFLNTQRRQSQGLFIHVPVLHAGNIPWIEDDFLQVLTQIQHQTQGSPLAVAA